MEEPEIIDMLRKPQLVGVPTSVSNEKISTIYLGVTICQELYLMVCVQ